MIEQKVNAIVAQFIRVLGPGLIRNFVGNNAGGQPASPSSDGSTATAKYDDDDDDNDFRSRSSGGSRVSISLPTFPPDEDEITESSTITSTSQEAISETTSSSQDRATDATTMVA